MEEATPKKASKGFFDWPIWQKVLQTDPSKPEEMQAKEVLSYSVAGLGQNLICQLVTSFFLFYLTDAVGLPALGLAIMFLCARLFDAFNDPIMGTIVDRTRTKYGKMRPYLRVMPVPIAVLTVLLFTSFVPTDTAAGETGAFALATIIYLAWGICYTIVDVPYWGLASSMTKDTDKRNTMLTIARLFCTIGAGIVTVFLPIVQGLIENSAVAQVLGDSMATLSPNGLEISKSVLMSMSDAVNEGYIQAVPNAVSQWLTIGTGVVQDGIEVTTERFVVADGAWSALEVAFSKGYKIMYLISAIVIACVAIPTFYLGYKNTHERFYDDDSKKTSLIHNLRLLTKNKPILLLIAVGFLGCLRLIYMTSGLYYAKYNLGNVGIFSTLTLLVVPGGLIATVTTPWLSRKFGKKNLFLFSHLLGGVAMTALYFVGLSSNGTSTASIWLFYVVLIILGLPSGYSNILQYSMIADSIDYLEWKTGERAEGICFSMQTLISKIGMAFVAFAVLLVLSVSGYDTASKVTAPDEIKSSIWMMTTLLSGVSTLACCIPLFFYDFTEKKQAQAVAEIAERKAAAAAAEEAVVNDVVVAE